MKNPKKRRKFTIIDLIMVLLAIILVWILLDFLGGHGFQFSLGNGSDPFGAIAETLSGLGEGIKNAFSGLLR
jgi:hypothetical protein